MGDIVFSDQPKTLKEEVINDDIKFTDQPTKSKVSKNIETAGNYVQDAGRLVKEAVSSAIATIP